MGKVLKPILLIAAVAVNVIPGVGQAISAGIFAATGATIGAAAALAATTAVLRAAGGAIKTGGKSAGSSLTSFDPKVINVDPASKRKMVFGRTAFPLDLRYGEPSGTNQEYIDYVFALAAHRSEAIDEIWIEDKQAWTLAGGAQGIYAGYLTVEIILEGGAAAYHTVNGGSTWGASQRMTGCTTMKVRVKRSNNTGTTSPFASGIAGRWTVIGRGMPLYDPALDSTVAGGSGSQRADDCTTWAYTASSVERGRNPALQLLAYLLGYRINDVVSVGLGMAPALIDLPSFATAAARCDESVALAGGGSHRRYEGGRFFADDDEPEGVILTLLAAMNAEMFDDGGRLGLRVAVNDMTAAITLTDDDIQNGFAWNPVAPPSEQFTLVRGRFQQPNAPSLFGLADYPDVTIPRTSPAPRPLLLDLSAVQDVRRAERIAKQVGQRSLYQGTFSTRIGIRGWFLRRNMIVAWTSQARGWSAKLFRVRSLRFNIDGTVDCMFREENAAVYQWDADETGNVSPVTPTTYDPRNAPWITAVATAATTALWPSITGTGKPDDNATRNDDGGNMIRSPQELDLFYTSPGVAVVERFTSGAVPNGIVDRVRMRFDFAGFAAWSQPNADGIAPYAAREGDRLFYYAKVNRSTGASGALRLKINYYDAALSNFFSQTVATFTGPNNVWTVIGGGFTCPAATAYAFPIVETDSDFYFAGDGYLGKTQIGADVTATVLANDATVIGTSEPITVGDLITAATTAAASPVAPKAITALGASAALDVVIAAGASRAFSAEVFFTLTAGSSITLSTPLEYRIGTGTWTGFGSGTGDTDTAPTTLFAEASGTLTNSGGDALNYQVRAVPAAPGGTGTVDASRSILRAS